MKRALTLLFAIGSLCTVSPAIAAAESQPPQSTQQQSSGPALRIESNLVFLDVTVLDKRGHPVVKGLKKDDFTITEDKQPQKIFSFEAPEAHILKSGAGDDNPEGNAPVTILVLDLLNSDFEDFAYIRYETKRFLMAQPAELSTPTELMVVGNESLELLQGYTRNRNDLMSALAHLPAALPVKKMMPSMFWERFAQSMDALQQIALENKGVPGRKNIVWVGHGGPNFYLDTVAYAPETVAKVKQWVHDTSNMMVDARASLFVIYPGLKVEGRVESFSARQAMVNIGDSDPFAGDVNFGVMVNETGGKLFFDRNDVDAEIETSAQMGANYYTLTYQPHAVAPDGRFRRIRVTLRDPNLHAVTKAGYYAPDKNAPYDARQQALMKLYEAAIATIPFSALDVNVSAAMRHPDTETAEFTVALKAKNLHWLPGDNGKDAVTLTVAAASLDGARKVLASKLEKVTFEVDPEKLSQQPDLVPRVRITVRVPKRTKTVRAVIVDDDGGQIGTAEMDRKAIDASPESPSPEPETVARPASSSAMR